MSCGSRNSSTYFMGLRLEAVPVEFFHRLAVFAHHRQEPQLFTRARFADLAHRESHVDEHPLTGSRWLFLQQIDVDLPAHAGDLHERKLLRAIGEPADVSPAVRVGSITYTVPGGPPRDAASTKIARSYCSPSNSSARCTPRMPKSAIRTVSGHTCVAMSRRATSQPKPSSPSRTLPRPATRTRGPFITAPRLLHCANASIPPDLRPESDGQRDRDPRQNPRLLGHASHSCDPG